MTMAARPSRPSLALGLLLLVLSMTLLAITSNAEPEIAADPWAPVDAVLKEGIESMAYPGCVALVGTTSVRPSPLIEIVDDRTAILMVE